MPTRYQPVQFLSNFAPGNIHRRSEAHILSYTTLLDGLTASIDICEAAAQAEERTIRETSSAAVQVLTTLQARLIAFPECNHALLCDACGCINDQHAYCCSLCSTPLKQAYTQSR